MKKFGRDHSRVFSFYLGQGAANQIEEKKPSSSSCHLTHFGAPINNSVFKGFSILMASRLEVRKIF